MSAWRRSGKSAPARRRAAYRPLSVGMQPLEPRAMMAADGLNSLLTYDVSAVSPEWSQQLQPNTQSGGGTGGLSVLDTVQTIQWKGESVSAYDDQWIVRLTSQGTAEYQSVSQVAGLFADSGFQVEVIGGLGLTGQVLVRTPGVSESTVSAWMSQNSLISYYEPNLILPLSQTPNDPNLSKDWALDNTGQTVGGTTGVADADIDAPEAWNISTGSSSVVVGVIDTGVDYTHPDLAANIWRNPGEIAGNGKDDDGNGFVDDVYGFNFVNNTGNVMDDNGHGTHVAGTIAAKGNNGTGITGVNWTSSVMVLKFLDANGAGSLSNAVRAINYATMMRQQYGVNVRVTNNSWGGGGYEQSLRDAISAAGQSGILFVAAAGNSGTNNDVTPNYPSNYDLPNVIAVAASDNRDNLTSFSNYGAATVDLAAPGMNIYSTAPGGGYQYMSGTSMAAPHVTGVAALAWAVDPSATVAQMRAALLGGVDKIASLAGKVASGGRLNALGTLNQMGLTVTASSPADGDTLTTLPTAFTIDFSQNIDPATVQAADFTVNGTAASSYTVVDGNTVTFRFNTSPVCTGGPQAMQIAEGAIGRLGGGIALRGWQASFYYDQVAAAVVTATPADGQTLASAPTTITLQFNEAIAAGSVGLADLALSAGTVTQAQLINPTTVRYTISLPSVNGAFTYTLARGALTDASGNPVAAYTGRFVVSDPALIRYQSTGAAVAIPDLGTVVSSITVSGAQTIRDVDVEVNVTHTWDNDVNLYLIAPNGTRIKLAADVGGGGKNFTGTVFDDSAITSISAGVAPFTGRFRPQESLAALNGLSTAGVWKLEVSDDYRNDTGSLNSWAIQFRVSVPPTIGAIADQNVGRSASAINVPISVSGGSGSLVVSAQAVDNNQNKASAALPVQVTVNALQNLLTITPASNYVGSFYVKVVATDGTASSYRYFQVNVSNAAPVLASVADQTISSGSKNVNVQLSASDANGDALSYKVSATAMVSNQAYELRQRFGLWAEPARVAGNYYCGFLGGQIKWLRGNGGVNDLYGIKPNGQLIHLVNFNVSRSPVVATLDASYWANPAKLTNAQFTQVTVGATVSANGLVTITPPAGFLGNVTVTAIVSDGSLSASQTFTLRFVAPSATAQQIGAKSVELAIGNATANAYVAFAASQAPQASGIFATQALDVSARSIESGVLAAAPSPRQVDTAMAMTVSPGDLSVTAAASFREELAAPKSFDNFARTRTESQRDYHDLAGKTLADFDAVSASLGWEDGLGLLPI